MYILLNDDHEIERKLTRPYKENIMDLQRLADKLGEMKNPELISCFNAFGPFPRIAGSSQHDVHRVYGGGRADDLTRRLHGNGQRRRKARD